MNLPRKNSASLKYQRLKSSYCKNIGTIKLDIIRKFRKGLLIEGNWREGKGKYDN